MLFKDDKNWLAACSHEGWYSVETDVSSSKELIIFLRKELNI